jgi:hypothetical protein
MPEHPQNLDASFPGFTDPDSDHGPFEGVSPNGYGYTVLGVTTQPPPGQPLVPGVGEIFENDFGSTGERVQPGVPVRRIDFSGYGASIYSDWKKPDQIPPAIIKVQFETTIGRTAYEVVKAASVIYPYCPRVVRTVTIQRRNAGWMYRTDTGWQPASHGLFQFAPPAAVTVYNGNRLYNFEANDPQTRIWFMLYAQVLQADSASYRNVLLDHLRGKTLPTTTRGDQRNPQHGSARDPLAGIVFPERDIEARLRLLNLPRTNALSVLAVEVLPGPLNFPSHIKEPGEGDSVSNDQEDPVGTDLVQRYIDFLVVRMGLSVSA